MLFLSSSLRGSVCQQLDVDFSLKRPRKNQYAEPYPTNIAPSAGKMILELIFSSFAIFNLYLLSPMLGLSTEKLKQIVRKVCRGPKAP